MIKCAVCVSRHLFTVCHTWIDTSSHQNAQCVPVWPAVYYYTLICHVHLHRWRLFASPVCLFTMYDSSLSWSFLTRSERTADDQVNTCCCPNSCSEQWQITWLPCILINSMLHSLSIILVYCSTSICSCMVVHYITLPYFTQVGTVEKTCWQIPHDGLCTHDGLASVHIVGAVYTSMCVSIRNEQQGDKLIPVCKITLHFHITTQRPTVCTCVTHDLNI